MKMHPNTEGVWKMECVGVSEDSAWCREAVSVDLSGGGQLVMSGCLTFHCGVRSLFAYLESGLVVF